MRSLCLASMLGLFALPAASQNINIPAQITEDSATPHVMPRFAKALIASLDGPAPELDSLFRAQLVAELDADALTSLDKLRAPLLDDISPRVRARYFDFVLYARSRLEAKRGKMPFAAAVGKTFRTMVARLDGRTSAIVVNGLSFDALSQANEALARDLQQLKGRSSISWGESTKLIADYNDRTVYRALGPTLASLIAADDARRYAIQKDVLVTMPDGAGICALIVRPLRAAALPALLQFTIYNDPPTLLREARRAASNGYVGVMGLTRGKGCSPAEIIPYEHDGADAAALIDWIVKQRWSDGKVGMYGGSYSGFTAWSALKHQPKALKAIMVGAPVAPGVDVPMEGNVVWNFIYPWPFYATTNKTLNDELYSDRPRWAKLDHDWYSSGRPYRDLDKIDGTPNPFFSRWLSHPAYDEYWQSLIPFHEEFARISIPVLQTAGYYYGGPGAAVYYLTQHLRYRPDAQHYLIIGPYEHFMGQRGTATANGDVDTISGYRMDPAAKIDLTEVRYRWFDYALKNGPKPAVLIDKINYQVTGANLWKHAPSLSAMASGSVRYFLSAEKAEHAYRLSVVEPADGAVALSVDLKDRRDVDLQTPGGNVQDKALDSTNGLVFISDPLQKPMEVSGLFGGHLEFSVNKRDFDFQVVLYELTADGSYLLLAPFWSRASHVQDLTRRELLTVGARQALDFKSVRLVSRQLKVGSRLVAVLSIIKEPGREINYGTGKEVADESLADALEPLRISWYAGSYLDTPVAW